MKRFCIISCFLVFCGFLSFGQKDVIISGGTNVSSVVCSNGYVYVAGSNYLSKYGYGVLGVGSNANYVSQWSQVSFLGSVTIQQVSSGGNHFVALDCSGTVWCWGENLYGQCGQDTTTCHIVTSPMRVPAGVLAGTVYEEDGYLTNVAVVSAGNVNCFAILGDGPYQGMVVAWGGNGSGASYASNLGDGTNTNQISPVWCMDLNENKVSGIIQVYAADYVAMLLDEEGNVWTTGGAEKSFMLGRSVDGGFATTTPSAASPYFGKVFIGENNPLSNIVQIAVGAVNCHALDADGYVYGWGDIWNNACGTGEIQASATPKKVVAGLLDEEDTEGGYLLARMIRAGTSCGYAVSKTGKPVMWGLFSSVGSYSTNQPRYVEYASSKVHDDVISVEPGRDYAFYRRSDGSIWAWGTNEYGQLGIGSTSSQLYATKINPPSSCNSFKDPYPRAFLSPRSVEACSESVLATEPVTLDCDFRFSSASLLNSYTITWYKDGEQVQTGNATKTTYKANEVGTYKVKIGYVGSNSGCAIYEPAEAEMTISAYEQEFTVDEDLHYCSDVATVKVTPLNSASTAEYTWYAYQPGTTELGKSIGDEEITIDLSGVAPFGVSGEKTIYVQETSMGSGLFLPENSSNWKNGMSDNINGTISNTYATGFSVNEPITLTSVSCYTNAYLYVAGNESATLTFTVYGAKTYNGGYIPNTSEEYGSFVGTKDVTSTNQNSEKLTATGSVSLPVGMYFIVPTNLERSDASVQFGLKRVSTSLATTNVDNITGTILQFQSVANGSIPNVATSGYIFDITFTAGQKYCGVVPVTLSQDCPCTIPDAPVVVDATYCYGDTPQELLAMTSAGGSLMWYEATTGSTVHVESSQDVMGGARSTHGSFYTFDNGVQTKVQLGDVATNVVFCFQTFDDSFRFLSGTEAANAIVNSQASETKFVMISDATQEEFETVDWSEGTTSIDIAKTLEAGQKSVAFKNALSEGFFEVVSYDEEAEDLTINVWMIEHAAPYNESTASTTAPMPNTVEVGKTTYYVSQIVNGCESEKTPITVTVNELPSVSISADKDEVCAGETITLTADADDSGSFTWSGDGVTENGNTATVTAIPTTPESITVTLNYVSEYNCEAQASATVTFLPVPTAPTAEDVSYCQNETAEMLTATASEGATLLWYESEKSVVASTKAPVPSTATVGDTAFYVSQILNGCESARTEIIATVNSVLTVGIAVDKDEVCVGETVSLMAMPINGLSYEWSGNGAEIGEHSSSITITPTESMSINLKFTGENGCESEASATITVKEIPEKPVAQSVSYCQNAVAQILTAIADGEQKWYIGDETSTTAPVPSTAIAGDTTYYVSQTVNGCESEKTAIKVTVNELPSVSIAANKTEICLGETVTLTANDESGNFAWSGGVTSTEKTVTFAPTETNLVNLKITNASGCESEASTTITVKAIPESPIAQSVTYCQGAVSQILTAIADGEMKWYIGDEASATAPVPSTATVGDTTYYVSQIVNGCESEKTAVVVTINELPTVSITANKTEICAGETVILTANAEDGTFAWSGGVTSTEKTVTFAPTETNLVSLKITNASGCESEASTTITVNAIPEKPVAQSISYCQNAVAQILTATADGEQKWYIGGEASSTAPVPSTAIAGDTTYYVSQIVNGCESEQTAIKVTISELPSVGITANKTEICAGETVTLTANADDGDFAWSGGVTSTEKTVSFAPTETTSVSVIFTNESGCENEASTTITVKAIPEKPVAQSVTYYQNAEAQILTAIADGKLKWYIGDEASATAPVPSTAIVGETTYYVSQIVNGCESEKTAITVTISAVNIIATEIPEIEISNEEETLPTVDLSAYYTTETSSDIDFTVTSSDPSIVDPVIRGDELEFVQYGDGTVTITVTATSGETVTSQSFTITVKPKPDQPTKPCELTVEPTITNVTCFGGEDGKIEVAVSGGVEPYTYKWNTGRTSKGIYAMAAGEYSILVRDSLGCTTTSTFTIEEPAEMSVSEEITNPSCGISNGSIAITIEGGTAPYTQRWYSGNGTIMESLENLQGDVYEVVIIDKNSCKLRKTYSLQESGAPSVSLKSVNASKCNEATGSCEIAVSSESEYTIVWSDATEATTEKSRSGMLPGTYTVTVNDAENCRSILSVTIPTETFRQPEIALVTVGEESGKNLVVWQKPETDMIAFYTVYREGDESGVYDKLGDVDFRETSIFVDPDANIMEQSWRYKISATDVCGNESPLSKEHKTIHLQKARGLDGEINLIWDSYEGIAYASYCLYRQTKSGSGLEMFKKVPASLNRYTDMNPPADVKGYYVAVVLPTEINENEPLKAESGPFALAISNIAEVENDGDIDAVDAVENEAVVYANGKNIVVLNANGKNVTINDITGRTIAQEKAVQSTVIPVQQVGVYLVTVGDKVQKVVVE